MSRPYCTRCATEVRLEQDGTSCSNCGATLIVTPDSAPTMPKNEAATIAHSHRRQQTTTIQLEDDRRAAHNRMTNEANNLIPEPEGTAA